MPNKSLRQPRQGNLMSVNEMSVENSSAGKRRVLSMLVSSGTVFDTHFINAHQRIPEEVASDFRWAPKA